MTEQVQQLIATRGPKAFHIAYHLTGNRVDAEDMVQEALSRVVTNWDRFDSTRPLPTWFFTILKNACEDESKRAHHRLTRSLDVPMQDRFGAEPKTPLDLLTDDSASPLDNLIKQEESTAVQKVLASLPPAHRKVLLLCGMDGASYDEAARLLGIPVGTVRSRLYRAKKAFRRSFLRLEFLARASAHV